MHLSRSSVPGQITISLNILANIINNIKRIKGFAHGDGYYILKFLMEIRLGIILRCALDYNNMKVILPAIHCLYCLMIDPATEAVQEILTDQLRGYEVLGMPSKFERVLEEKNMNEEDDDDADVLTDHEIIQKDFVLGLLHIGILVRLRYILEVLGVPSAESQVEIIKILQRISLHSTESAQHLIMCPRILNVISEKYLVPNNNESTSSSSMIQTISSSTVSLESLKLLRMIISTSKENALWVIQQDLLPRDKFYYFLSPIMASSQLETQGEFRILEDNDGDDDDDDGETEELFVPIKVKIAIEALTILKVLWRYNGMVQSSFILDLFPYFTSFIALNAREDNMIGLLLSSHIFESISSISNPLFEKTVNQEKSYSKTSSSSSFSSSSSSSSPSPSDDLSWETITPFIQLGISKINFFYDNDQLNKKKNNTIKSTKSYSMMKFLKSLFMMMTNSFSIVVNYLDVSSISSKNNDDEGFNSKIISEIFIPGRG
eukprot:TRINITY_DN1072_c0_g1_i12.p1 TRINITY_DN1072_c0_g1~~TRINITY_DN1072_c0_g1_i12.p1  ORF type:complete len:491 (+),score=146.98 TRINITY_DN1072_c0_g1_i12:2085-3557(+)